MPDIMHLIRVKASPERVFQALTTAEGIRSWWTRDADLDRTIGGHGEFHFNSYGSNHVTQVQVGELVEHERIVWNVTDSFRPEWIGTTIEFHLRAEAGNTVIRLAHRGYQQADENYALCTTGWGYYLVSLQQYLQTGQGAPSPDIDFAIVLK